MWFHFCKSFPLLAKSLRSKVSQFHVTDAAYRLSRKCIFRRRKHQRLISIRTLFWPTFAERTPIHSWVTCPRVRHPYALAPHPFFRGMSNPGSIMGGTSESLLISASQSLEGSLFSVRNLQRSKTRSKILFS